MEKLEILKDKPLEELTEFFVSLGEKPYRAKQVFKWLMNGARTWDEMTDLSLGLRAKLAGTCVIDSLSVADIAVSEIDGTRKYLFETRDGLYVEAVLMEYYYGWSLCISSQAGCRMGCRFCASGRHGLQRNLTPAEIADQYIICERDVRNGADAFGRPLGESGRVRYVKHTDDEGKSRIGHIVMMGVGEPFDNYENVMTFLKNITAPEGRNLGRRQITVSTCGLTSGMRRFMTDLPQANLSLSLHAPNDEIRNALMPVGARHGVRELIAFAREYARVTGRRFTFEYALFDGVNDDLRCADELADLLASEDSSANAGSSAAPEFHVNLIPANAVPELGYAPPPRARVTAFAERLLSRGIRTTTRRELGSDIAAACGQLRSEKMETF
ncbi:MAG: 23S rRNA (adenine(2503)-C(2))-methyltransferase RlmN [Clostridiales Family XIII bacterium]|jgi:23S rRNA (adenine2503-C2)-methyltransferase|nr:23S rRNA (adenine(2503)-C(2))-methyltransferase RlmN [Clostridiales Family XIII bacterium]